MMKNTIKVNNNIKVGNKLCLQYPTSNIESSFSGKLMQEA